MLTDGLGILVGLALSRCAGVLSVVGKFIGKSVCGDRIGVNDGGTPTGNHGPDAPFRVEHSKLE